jgi:hypothetical protein
VAVISAAGASVSRRASAGATVMARMLAEPPETGERDEGQERGDDETDHGRHDVPVPPAGRIDARPARNPRPPPDDGTQEPDVQDGSQDERGEEPVPARPASERQPAARWTGSGELEPDDDGSGEEDDGRPREVDGEETVQPARAEAEAAASASRRMARRYS